MSSRNITLAEAAQHSGINVEDLHGMLWKDSLSGTAMPGNRTMGTILETALEALLQSRRQNETQACRMA